MRHDSRLPRVLHALLHLDQLKAPATSDLIAEMLQTNAAVVRRTMAGLRDAGIVTSLKGHRGGWSLAKPLTEISFMDIYAALGSPALFAIGNDEGEPTCLLARAANYATTTALEASRRQFEESLRGVSIAELSADWRRKMESCRESGRDQVKM